MTDSRKIIAALHWPGYVSTGSPDVSAKIAEVGPGYDTTTTDGRVDVWDWQRYVPEMQRDGTIRTFEYEGRGHLKLPRLVTQAE